MMMKMLCDKIWKWHLTASLFIELWNGIFYEYGYENLEIIQRSKLQFDNFYIFPTSVIYFYSS